jgi:Saxitoxin biosynthesis operon protein SxtJ
MTEKKVTNSELRSFGLIIAAGFAVIAVAPALFRGQRVRSWALGISLVFAVTGLVFPAALRSFRKLWMILGEGLGWVNSRIILGVVYFLVIVPIGAIRRISADDPMQRKFKPDAASYKIPRASRPASHMQRQY